LTIDGGRTLAWELEASVAAAGESLDRLFVQVGGGALMSAVAQGLALTQSTPRFHAVQTEGCYPLARAWKRVRALGLSQARKHRSAVMTPWETTPTSIAHGILDDETYDWAACVEAMGRSGGWPIVVSDDHIERATKLGREAAMTENPVSHTGAAGLAGLIAAQERGDVPAGETIAVIFSGRER
jgi:threonine synthase